MSAALDIHELGVLNKRLEYVDNEIANLGCSNSSSDTLDNYETGDIVSMITGLSRIAESNYPRARSLELERRLLAERISRIGKRVRSTMSIYDYGLAEYNTLRATIATLRDLIKVR